MHLRRIVIPVLAIFLSLIAGSAARSQDKGSAGIVISKDATSKDLGLPIYPGATRHKDTKHESSSVNLGLWGSSFGFRIAVLKLESADPPSKIGAFYQKPLAKYGPVLDCARVSADSTNKKTDSNRLTCEDDKPDHGELLFKSGSKEKQHIVAIQPNGNGSLIQLVYLQGRSAEKEAM